MERSPSFWGILVGGLGFLNGNWCSDGEAPDSIDVVGDRAKSVLQYLLVTSEMRSRGIFSDYGEVEETQVHENSEGTRGSAAS